MVYFSIIFSVEFSVILYLECVSYKEYICGFNFLIISVGPSPVDLIILFIYS
jgi:hypothetical protein